MSDVTYSSAQEGRRWPTRRMATWAEANGITTVAALDAWLAANVTNLAEARLVFRELVIALVESAEGGESGT